MLRPQNTVRILHSQSWPDKAWDGLAAHGERARVRTLALLESFVPGYWVLAAAAKHPAYPLVSNHLWVHNPAATETHAARKFADIQLHTVYT